MRSPRLGRLVGLTLLLALAACQSGTGSADPDAGNVTNVDATASLADANSSLLADASQGLDGGGGGLDGGGGGLDGGGGGLDGGGGGLDGGGGSIGLVCQEVCAMAEQCFGETDSGCVAECTADLAANCSQSEIDQIDACSNGLCDAFETCLFSVPCLGGGGGGDCGDGFCDAQAGEACSSCPQDCGACVCGDGTCSAGECSSCASDCPGGCTCGDVCTTGPAQDSSCDPCQATVCGADSFCCEVEWDGICVNEAESLCGKDCPAFCGDTVCDANENPNSCPQDCGDIGQPPPLPPTP